MLDSKSPLIHGIAVEKYYSNTVQWRTGIGVKDNTSHTRLKPWEKCNITDNANNILHVSIVTAK